MSNLQSQITYPLLPYSRLVWEMIRWMPSIYRFPIVLRWRDGAKERARVEHALRLALENHPAFTMQVDRKGMHFQGQLADIAQGKYHRFFCSEAGEDVLIHAELCRILGDGRSIEILAEDLYRAFNGQPLEPDDYWGYVARFEQRQSDPHYRISQDWLNREFADSSVPVRPTMDRRGLFTLLPPKAGLLTDDYTSLHERLERFKEESFLSYEGIFSLCTALAIAEYCGTDEGALTWAYEGRETLEEQRIFGSLHRDIPFQIKNIKYQISNLKSDLIREARNQIRSGIAHSDYPYTLTAPYDKRWNYAVNVLRSAEPQDMLRHIDLPIEVISVPEQKYAYALLDVEIHEHPQDLSIWFRYSATHYKESSIRRFAALVRNYVEWLLEE